MAKLLFSGPWLKSVKDGWAMGNDSAIGFWLCHDELDRLFSIPPAARRIKVHLYDKSAHSNCVGFYLEVRRAIGNWHRGQIEEVLWSQMRGGAIRKKFCGGVDRRLIRAPLWKDGKATVWAEIEWK